jgi:hypothetical protein
MTTQISSAAERMSPLPITIFAPPLPGGCFPWQLPYPPADERSNGGGEAGPSLTEVLDAVYLRPDVRAAVVANARAFAKLLSKDDEAARAFNELVGNLDAGTTDERVAPLVVVAVVAGCGALGAFVGWLSRP